MDQPEEPMSELEEQKFEEDLVRMLRRIDPPVGFAERTMARVSAQTQTPAKVIAMRPRPRSWFSGAIAATLLVGIFVTDQAYQHHEREQAAQAQMKFEAGMRITDRALEHAQRQLERAGVRIGD